MRSLLQDLKYALRQMRHAPGFSISVVVVLALGIGANAAMFTVLEGTLFRPLPYARADELVAISATTSKDQPALPRLADLLVWRSRSRTLSEIAYSSSGPAYLRTEGREQMIVSVRGSANLFAMLGAAPALGRTFTADEQQPGRDKVAVLSDAVWSKLFHADPNVLGQTVRIDDEPVTVIGVMPKAFVFSSDSSPAQVWRPAELIPADLGRGLDASGYEVVGRRRSGTSVAAVEGELDAMQKQLYPLYTGESVWFYAPAHLHVTDYRRSLSENNQRTALLALLGAVGALWLIACANVACLTLARTAARRREMAVRAALGASRWRLVRQTLAESLLLSLSGGAVGFGLAVLVLRFFEHSLLTQLDANLNLHPDARVLFALFGLSVVTGILFALVPARLASRAGIETALRQDGTQAGTGRHQHRLQRVLVVAELALTLTLLVSCGLLLHTVFALRHVPLGFRTEHVLVIDPQLPSYKYGYGKLDPNMTVYRPLLERVKQIPGVESAAITTVAPLVDHFNMTISMSLGKTTNDGSGKILNATMRATGPELQKVFGFGMARGRYFNAQDTADSPLVAVVNSAFAKLYEPDNGDIGSFSLGMSSGDKGEQPRKFKIVGVLDDLHQMGIARSAMPEIDLNAAQLRPTDGFYQPTLKAYAEIALRSSRDAKSLEPELHHVMQEFNPDLAGAEIRTMDQIVEDAMGSQILAAHLLEALGGLALIVALAGLYSLQAYLVTLRTRELGLRLALGAQREDILSLVLRGAGVLLVAGTLAGVGISLLAVRMLHSFLFGVKEYDLVSLVGAPVLLLAVGTFAAWLPARRASRLEPMEALRTE